MKDDLPGCVKKAVADEVLIRRHGKPAAILLGFADEDDWFDCYLEHDERFFRRATQSREQAQNRRFTRPRNLREE